MRKIIYNLATSLDGFIEGPNGEFDWCFTDQDYGMAAFLDQTDAILFGRKSYELMLQFEDDPYPGKMKYVISHNYQTNAKDTQVVKENIAGFISNLKQKQGKNIWLFGGANLAGELLKNALVDELQVSLHPVLLGSGKPLFLNQVSRKSLKLIHSKTYESGLVQLTYQM